MEGAAASFISRMRMCHCSSLQGCDRRRLLTTLLLARLDVRFRKWSRSDDQAKLRPGPSVAGHAPRPTGGEGPYAPLIWHAPLAGAKLPCRLGTTAGGFEATSSLMSMAHADSNPSCVLFPSRGLYISRPTPDAQALRLRS